MLKQAVAALLLANLGTALYTQGGLRWVGLGALDEREPQRLAQQLHPEQLQLLAQGTPASPTVAAAPAPTPPTPEPAATPTPPAAPAAPVPAPMPAVAPAAPEPKATPATAPPPEKPPAPEKTDKADKAKDPEPAKTAAKRRGKTNCWQASGYTPVQTIVLNGALDRVPELDKRWQIVATTSGSSGRWLVYQGGFASADALKQQRAEFKLANIDHRPVQLPGESGPGLVLGTYSSEAGAQRALQNAQHDGISNLRVVPEKGGSATRSYTLTLKAITEEEKALVEGLGPALAGKTLQRCP